MKILVYGAGVIGTAYAWQLSETGCDVSLFVRKQKLVRYTHSGISISCTDYRDKKTRHIKTVFRPKTTDRIDSMTRYDLIIVSVKNFQIDEALSTIARNNTDADILFLGHFWDKFDQISKQLPGKRFLYGFPAITGGSRAENGINCFLLKNEHTIIGEPDGRSSLRLSNIVDIFNKAGLCPKISHNIMNHLKTRYIWSAAMFGAICKAGNAKAFAGNNKLMQQWVFAVREGLTLCRKDGFRPARVFPLCWPGLPPFILVPILKRFLREGSLEVIEGRMKHGFDEMEKQYKTLLRCGDRHNTNMPVLASFSKYIADAERTRSI